MMKCTALRVLIISSIFTQAVHSSEDKNAGYEQVFSKLALHCIHQEYPNVIKHSLNSGDDVQPPSTLYPAFYGCLDWHSSVHGHWLLVRMLNVAEGRVDRDKIVTALNKSFTTENIGGELRSLTRENNSAFERPYGLAWFLQLTAELRESQFPEAKKWLSVIEPLETEIVLRLSEWLNKLAYPIRTGEHSQTAFAFGLMLDWARISGDETFESLLSERVKDYYLKDQNCPILYEPSGQDFLSPCLAEADLMRRVLTKEDYSAWLTSFLPSFENVVFKPAAVTDKSDGKLAHLDGLNTSRAWMLAGIISALGSDDPRLPALKASLKAHREAGLHAVFEDMHYMGSHWLGSFAAYLETERGIMP